MRESRFWAKTAITLGAWETLGVIGVVPTISATVVRARKRSRIATGVAVAAWEVALYRYLMTRQ